MTTNRIVAFIKQYFFMVALAATFVGFSAFKITNRIQPSDAWFNITATPNGDIENPENQLIGTTTGTPDDDPQDGQCRIDNESEPCAVHLDLGQGTDPLDLTGMTVQEALDSDDVDVSLNTTIGDGYAKQRYEFN